MDRTKLCLPAVLLNMLTVCSAVAMEVDKYPVIESVIEKLTTQHGYPKTELLQVFSKARLRPSVVAAIKKPYEALPWHRYRKLFVTDKHTRDGMEFWNRHKATLERAERQFGVPQHVIVAIIGVETRYGQSMGRHRVLDSLTTLVVQYPRRRPFFSDELVQFLLLTREEGLDPLKVKGSYAGAMGVPQFIASSYRHYAVDFNGDQRKDLIGQPEDAIGSVANYLHRHRWQAGKPIAGDAVVNKTSVADQYVTEKLKTNSTVARLTKAGISSSVPLNGASSAALVRLDNGGMPEYRIVFNNFYVITKYNRSVHYAMAVFELGEELRKRRAAS
jgi:membrane-bound lytic murein transglycosylase B